jgi:hypothetical protein
LVALPLDGVDGKDAACTASHRTQQRGDTDTAEADDCHIVARLNFGRSRRRPESGCHAAADERGGFKRYGLVDLHQ